MRMCGTAFIAYADAGGHFLGHVAHSGVVATRAVALRGPSTDAAYLAIFPTAIAHDARRLGSSPLPQANAYSMVDRCATVAGIGTKFGNHTFRATGIIARLSNDEAFWNAMATATANYASARRTRLYDLRRNEVSSIESSTSAACMGAALSRSVQTRTCQADHRDDDQQHRRANTRTRLCAGLIHVALHGNAAARVDGGTSAGTFSRTSRRLDRLLRVYLKFTGSPFILRLAAFLPTTGKPASYQDTNREHYRANIDQAARSGSVFDSRRHHGAGGPSRERPRSDPGRDA